MYRVGTSFTHKRLWPQLLFGLKRKHQQLAEPLVVGPQTAPASPPSTTLPTPMCLWPIPLSLRSKQDPKAQQQRSTCCFQLYNLPIKTPLRLLVATQQPAPHGSSTCKYQDLAAEANMGLYWIWAANKRVTTASPT